MKPFKTQAHIHSLDGQMDEITVLKELGNNSYLVDYRGVKCSAIFNPFGKQYSNSAANTDYSANISASSNFTKEVYQNG